MAFDTEELMRRALALHQSGDHAGAAELYRSILDGVPGHPGANHFYGLLLHQRGDNAAALEHMTRSLKGGPPTPAFLANIGGVHADEWRLDEAEDFFKKALRLSPSMPEALLGAGLVAQKRGDCGRAEDFYRRALKTDPNSAQAHWNLALLLLLTGRYEEGWREHEWRFHGKSNWRFPPPDVAALRAARRPSALVNEMGLGDVIQFMRFFPVARGLWPELDLKYVCMPSLSRLFMDSFGRNLMAAEGAVLDGGVEPIPLLSMPFLLGLSPEAVDGRPYLRAGDRAVQSWGRDMEADAGPRSLKVGLAWAGSPTHRNDRVRSIHLSRLSRILEIPGVSFFSLQRGHGAEQLLSIPENLRPFD